MSLTREQVRAVDRVAIEDYGVPGIVLMENAGRGAAELLLRLGVHAPVAICCGKGNNGGDGFVIARHLHNHGKTVKVLLFGEPNELSGDAAINYEIVRKSGLSLKTMIGDELRADRLQAEFFGCEWIVDALFGTGLKGPVRAPFADVIDMINQSGLRVFSVDIPSGLDCDSGKPQGATVRATVTATFVAEKKEFEKASSREWTGLVHVIDIGAPIGIRQLAEKSGT